MDGEWEYSTMKFKAKIIDGKTVIEPFIEKKENGDVVVHVPSLSLINKFNKEEKNNGIRNLQQV